ncbi:hypothetical protein FNV43_RR26241 [Rhamnella rubrinervis]|uniref:Transmembrane protein n=1 Tax=Rhamnella rubrinervis TaxID=2594499 RepID=A0A8K0DIG1_9ROSA|nr:hypothetical protein FNV43_RR26241 [Rhamnella rubrinervis]
MDGSLFPDDFSEWEQIDSPFAIHHSGASSAMESVGHNCIHDDGDHDDVVFPPTHHEGLQLPHPTTTLQAPPDAHQPVDTISQSSSSSSAMSSDGDDEARDSQPWLASGLVGANEIWRRLRLGFGVMSAGALRMASKFCDYKLRAGAYWAVASMTGVVTAVLVSLYVRVLLRRWRPRAVDHLHDKERMVLLVREKDEKISQLLLRVARMNESLTSPRRVPVLRIGRSSCV